MINTKFRMGLSGGQGGRRWTGKEHTSAFNSFHNVLVLWIGNPLTSIHFIFMLYTLQLHYTHSFTYTKYCNFLKKDNWLWEDPVICQRHTFNPKAWDLPNTTASSLFLNLSKHKGPSQIRDIQQGCLLLINFPSKIEYSNSTP